MFSEPQVKALSSKLSAKYVRTRQQLGLTLSYIEGWHAIAEANRIFGYDAWDRQTMAVRCVWEGTRERQSACSYIARVRVRVRAGDSEICREGCGSGHGVGPTPGEVHESAIKEAETDAMKRALSTFGNPFGLALYDKEQQNVRGRRKKAQKIAAYGQDRPITWLVLSSEGEYLSAHEDPVDYCKAVRQLLEAIPTRERLRAFWLRNLVTIAMLRRNLPDLKTDKGEHYADILTSLYKHQMRLVWEEQNAYERRAREPEEIRRAQELAKGKQVQDRGDKGGLLSESVTPANRVADVPDGRHDEAPEPSSAQLGESQAVPGENLRRRETGNGGPVDASSDLGDGEITEITKSMGKSNWTVQIGEIDKTNLLISKPRRVRDKGHLRYVASQPCLICGRSPGHAHHLRFAQPRALGRKVSDEWSVPLCLTHHRAVHGVGSEKRWWKDKGIDPIAHAVRLWWDTRHGGVQHRSGPVAGGNYGISHGLDGPKEKGQKRQC